MASPWDRLGGAASVMQLTGVDAMGLVSMIVQAARIAHRNRDQCLQLAQHVQIVGSLLPKLQIPELRRHPETRRPLDQLNEALRRALELVRSCWEQQQTMNQLYQMFAAANMADKLRRAQDEIDFYIKLIPAITTIADRVSTLPHSLVAPLFPRFLSASYLLNQQQATYQDDETNDLTPAQRPSLSLGELPPTGTVAQQPIMDIVGNVVSQPVVAERQQRSGPSSSSFTWAQLEAATNRFALEATICLGSLGIVYRGVLPDKRELAIKRCKSEQLAVRLQQKKFRSRLDFLSRLRHKHLVGLMGYCIRNDECLFVYEYMKNGSLQDHLDTYAAPSPVTKSWRLRFKILLDACRGIEYLHSYAVPPVVHGNIKSSNILLDGGWTARVSDFGNSLMAEPKANFVMAEVLSDIRSFGLVMAEVLSGRKRDIRPLYPPPTTNELLRDLDSRVSASNWEEKAVDLVTRTAKRCIDDSGRLAMAEIVASLGRAVALCEGGAERLSQED